ncbi:MAG: o-succinylbenzoate synthase [Marinilabiliaceae bacterium]
MLKASYHPYTLRFKTPGGTSRGVLTEKKSFLLSVWEDTHPHKKGTGECSLLPGLTPDNHPGLEEKIRDVCENIGHYSDHFHQSLSEWPALRFAVETALKDLEEGGEKILFPSLFTEGKAGIPINGLIWMGSPTDMQKQIEEKLAAGFHCLKMKIGAIHFSEEHHILETLRKRFSPDQLEIRVDANGAFSPKEAPRILEQLARLRIHSIEQPIAAGQWQAMKNLCQNTPIPIALDEELIGIHSPSKKEEMVGTIRPQYIILKPGLLGGFQATSEWIETARKYQAEWWNTSALESNIGLNALAQWTFTLNNPLPQGLGTGQVFSNNIDTGRNMTIRNGELWMNK